MKLRTLKAFTLIIFGVILFSKVQAQLVNGDKDAAKAFVQKFYDWYVPVYNLPPNPKAPSSIRVAVTKKKDVFDVTLYKALIDYLNTPPVEEMDGLDSDPFINGQDAGKGYEAGNVKQIGNKFFVDIHNIEKGKSSKATLAAEVVVIPEVAKVKGKWVFINFTFPFEGKRYDLLDMLNNIRKQRSSKKAHKS